MVQCGNGALHHLSWSLFFQNEISHIRSNEIYITIENNNVLVLQQRQRQRQTTTNKDNDNNDNAIYLY